MMGQIPALLVFLLLSDFGLCQTNTIITVPPLDYEPFFPSASSCSAVSACSHLAGDCCPTSYAGGVFLDCCREQDQQTAAACSANPGCAGLEGDCCPSVPGNDLYCCYASGESGFVTDYTLYGHPNLRNQAVYLTSTGDHLERKQDNEGWIVDYRRSVNQQYDLAYFLTDAITDASKFVTGEHKFYITIDATSVAPCTQIILQLDTLPTANATNYPLGRHSRYLATYTQDNNNNGNNARLEFDFLDRPDLTALDTEINAIGLLFDPGTYKDQQWQWSFLDVAVACSADSDSGCTPSPVKRCEAVHVGPATCDNNDIRDCENPACTNSPDCAFTYVESFLALEDRRTTAVESGSSKRHSVMSGSLLLVMMGIIMTVAC